MIEIIILMLQTPPLGLVLVYAILQSVIVLKLLSKLSKKDN